MDKEIYIFGASYILEQTRNLEGEIEGVLTDDDIEFVHRMRVASRRLRNALGLFIEYFPENYAEKWRGEIKGITKALGNARDLDIQIQLVEEKYQEMLDESFKPGYQRLLLRLKQKRTKAQEKVVTTIHSLKESRTLEEMKHLLKRVDVEEKHLFAPALYTIAQRAINHALDTFLSFEEFIETPNNSEKLHAMRIAGKHFRYTMEIFVPLYRDGLNPFIEIMKEIQDQLGEIRDCDVWIVWLPQFIEQEQGRIKANFGHTWPLKRLFPGVQHLIEDRMHTRQEEYDAFFVNWQILIEGHCWLNLRKNIESGSSL